MTTHIIYHYHYQEDKFDHVSSANDSSWILCGRSVTNMELLMSQEMCSL